MQRPKISFDLQVRVFFRDRWLCYLCHRPTIFGPAIKYLEKQIQESDYEYPISYYHAHWRRDLSPLLDDLGTVLDHRKAYSKGGDDSEDNLVTACNKCNTRKSNKDYQRFVKQESFRRVKGFYGEPLKWDGLAGLFIILSNKYSLTLIDKQWKKALQGFLSSRESSDSHRD